MKLNTEVYLSIYVVEVGHIGALGGREEIMGSLFDDGSLAKSV